MKENKFLKKWIYWFLFAVAVIGVYKTLDNFGSIAYFIKNLLNVLMPFIIGIIIAYLFYIPTIKAEKLFKKSKFKIVKSKAKTISILIIYALVIFLIIISMKYLLPAISNSVIELTNNLQYYYDDAVKAISEIPEDSILNKIDIKGAIKELKNIDIKQFLNIERLTEYAKGAISIATGIFNIFVAVIVSIYILSEREEIIGFAKKASRAIFKDKAYKNIGKYFLKTNQVFLKFLYSQFVDAIVVGVLTSIAMSILKVKYAILLGVLIGIFNMIPYFGAIIAVVIATLLTIFTGGLTQSAIMFIVVVILQQIDANIINPKIIGDSLEISPLLVIFAVTIGGEYFGVLGMFLAVPIITIIKIIIEDYIDYKNKTKIDKIDYI